MKKPIIYYQFDQSEYRKKHLEEGYFDYSKDGFGDVIKNSSDVVKKIDYYISNNYKIEKKYLKRIDDFFELHDKNNCDRIFEEVCSCNLKTK